MLEPAALARFLVTAFFAVVFLQSAVDKLMDAQGNAAFFKDHFKSSPIPTEYIPWLLLVITGIEGAAGLLCATGLIFFDFVTPGMGVSAAGLAVSGIALLGLLTGQRLAKDYAGAAVIAAYFAVDLIGLLAFAK